jgi:hypothetical protein
MYREDPPPTFDIPMLNPPDRVPAELFATPFSE